MITEAMWRELNNRRFSEHCNAKAKPRRNMVHTVQDIHRMIDDGHPDKLIATRLGVSIAQVNYRRQKIRGMK